MIRVKLQISGFLWLVLSALVASCNFDKPIDVNLPPHVSQLTLECYVVPGEQAKLLLTETKNYFDPPRQPFINSSVINWYTNGRLEIMPLAPVADTTNKKVFNYSLPTIIPADTTIIYRIEIKDTAGRIATSQCRMLPPAQIDSVYWQFRGADSAAYLVTLIKTQPRPGGNYYRVLFNKGRAGSGAVKDLLADDGLFANGKIPVVTDFSFRKGDTVNVRVLHISKEYYDFLQTTQSSQRVAGNPFAQPIPVKTNINGGFGIFTAFIPVEQKVVLR